MSKRKTGSALVLVAALVLGLAVGQVGKVADAAAKPNAAKAKPANPRGPKAIYPLNRYGPSPDDNVALRWNEQALALIRRAKPAPTVVSRMLAVAQTSVYDAWAAYDAVAVGTRLGGSLRQPPAARTAENKDKAISYAAYRSLLDLFPAAELRGLTRQFMVDLGYDPDDASTDRTTAAGVGNVAAKAVLDHRHGDGANQLGDVNRTGQAYSDYTGYRPVNTPDTVVDKWRWQPLLVQGNPQRFATPQWGRVAPFALARADQFPVPGPDLRKDYKKAVKDIVKFSAKLTDTDKVIAEYWADGPGSELPPGHGAMFAAALCRKAGGNLDHDVKMLFLQANAVLDAGIAVWHYKVAHDFVRPVTLVRELLRGEKIRAWGGPGKGTVEMLGEQWMPYQPENVVTPPFAEYVSGHSTFSAATFEVLRRFTGTDSLNLSVTVKAGSSPVEPGLTPAHDVTLTWRTMQDVSDEAGYSREYGGIHFREGNLHGRDLGERIGAAVYAQAQRYFAGTGG